MPHQYACFLRLDGSPYNISLSVSVRRDVHGRERDPFEEVLLAAFRHDVLIVRAERAHRGGEDAVVVAAFFVLQALLAGGGDMRLELFHLLDEPRGVNLDPAVLRALDEVAGEDGTGPSLRIT